MNKQILVCLCLLALLVPLGLSAQTPSNSQPASNTYAATALQFKTETDKYMSVTDWMAIKTSIFSLSMNNTSVLDLGVGFKLTPDFFLSAWYNGNILTNSGSGSPTESTNVNSTLLLNNNVITGKTVTTTQQTTNDVMSSQNQGSVLVGFSNMGIKLGAVQSNTTTKSRWQVDALSPDMTTTGWTQLTAVPAINQADSSTKVYAADGTTLTGNSTAAYTGGVKNVGSVAPYLAWGGVFNLGGNLVLKPIVDVAYYIGSNNLTQSYADYVQAIGSSYPAFNGSTEVAAANTVAFNQKADYGQLTANAKLALDIPSGTDLISVGLFYNLDLPIYSNAYTDSTGAGATATGFGYDYHKVNYTYNVASTQTTEDRAYQVDAYSNRAVHTITPSVQYRTNLAPTLAFSGQLDLPMVFENYSHSVTGGSVRTITYTDNVNANNNYTDVYTKSYSGDTTSYSSFDLSPVLKAGLQYDVLPKVLKFNLGGTFGITGVYNTNTAVTRPGVTTITRVQTMADGTKATDTYASTLGTTRNESQNTTTTWNGLSSSLSAGINYVLVEGVSLDLYCITGWLGGNIASPLTFTVELQIVK